MLKLNSLTQWLADKLLDPAYQRSLLAVVIVILLVAGLYPFKFNPKNQVTWLPDSTGVLFHRHGEIVGVSPLSSGTVAGSNPLAQEVTLELWLTTLNDDPDVKDVLSIYVSRAREPFAIDEWGDKLIFGGIFRDAQGRRKFRHIGVEGAFAPGARRFITLTSGSDGCKLYLEGKLQQEFPGIRLEPESFDGMLLLGNTPSARQEWRGAIRGVAFYRKDFSADEVLHSFSAWQRRDWPELQRQATESAIYPFDEGEGMVVRRLGNLGADLSIPHKLRAVDPIILERPSRHDFTNLSDVSLNILGFIPFGGLALAYLVSSRGWSTLKALIFAIAVGFLLSLMIELLQVLLPSRDSSLLDLINNTFGTAIGAGLAMVIWPRLKKFATASRHVQYSRIVR